MSRKLRNRISIAGGYMAYYGFFGAVGAGFCNRVGLDGWAAFGLIAGTLAAGALIQYGTRLEFIGPEG